MSSIYERGVLLGYAFEVLGKRLYDNAWDSNQLVAVAKTLPERPEDVASRQAILEANLKTLTERRASLTAVRDSGDAEFRASIDPAIKMARQQENRIRVQIDQLGTVDDAKRMYEWVQRSLTIKDRIVDALDRGRLEALTVGGSVIQSSVWKAKGQADFDWKTSIVVFRGPFVQQYGRRTIAFIDRQAVDQWINEIAPPDDQYEWLRSWFLRRRNQPKPAKTKNAIFLMLEKQRPDLTRAILERGWKTFAPTHWKRSGRPGPASTSVD